MLIGTKDGANISQITDNMGFGDQGYAYVMGPDGSLFGHPNIDLVQNKVNVLTDEGEFKDWGNALEKLGIGNTGAISYKLDNSLRYMGISPSQVEVKEKWIIRSPCKCPS